MPGRLRPPGRVFGKRSSSAGIIDRGGPSCGVCPDSIAVVGASRNPAKLGNVIVSNIIEAGYKGTLYPVNPGLDRLDGRRAYPSLGAIPGPVDLVIVVVPMIVIVVVCTPPDVGLLR